MALGGELGGERTSRQTSPVPGTQMRPPPEGDVFVAASREIMAACPRFLKSPGAKEAERLAAAASVQQQWDAWVPVWKDL